MDGELISIILAIVLWIGAGFLGKVKDLAKKSQSMPSPSASAPSPAAEQKAPAAPTSLEEMLQRMQDMLQEEEDSEAHEEYFEEYEENEDLADAYEERQHQEKVASEEMDILGNRVFSYEASSAMPDIAAEAQVQEETHVAPIAGSSEGYIFNLRQAVINQTILENKYISDWK